MSLEGNWISVEHKDWSGKKFIVCSIEYNGKPWDGLSTFDSDIIAEAEKIEVGQPVTFETKKGGKYTNIVMLNDVRPSGKQPSGGGTKASGGGGYKQDTPEVVFGKTLTQLVNGYLSAGSIPNDKEMAELAIIAKNIQEGKYYR